MPCTYTPSPQEERQEFERRALYDSPATVLLCEATMMLEDHGLLKKCSLKLKRWHAAHAKQDAKRIKDEMAGMDETSARIAALKKLSPRERKLLGVPEPKKKTKHRKP